MSNTITYAPVNDGDHYTIAEINALFAGLAAVINNKIDSDDQEADVVIISDGEQVFVTNAQDQDDPVVLTQTVILPIDLTVNGQEIINAGLGVNPGDSVNVLQALQLLGIA